MDKYGYTSTSQVFGKHVVGNATDVSTQSCYVLTCPVCHTKLSKIVSPVSNSKYGCHNCGYIINIRYGNWY